MISDEDLNELEDLVAAYRKLGDECDKLNAEYRDGSASARRKFEIVQQLHINAEKLNHIRTNVTWVFMCNIDNFMEAVKEKRG